MRIMIVTDAWFPQTNGVVRTLAQTAAWLGRFGHEVRMLTPRDFRSVACPTYPEIRLSLFPRRRVRRAIEGFAPQALHIATEGPLGLAARLHCRKAGHAFHHVVPHPISSICAGALSHPDQRVLSGAALVSRSRRPLHGQHRVGSAGPGRPGLQEFGGVAARGRHRGVQASAQGVPQVTPPDRRLRGSGGRREEYRSLSANALERQQDRDRRRAGARAPAGAVPGDRSSRVTASKRSSPRTWRLRT